MHATRNNFSNQHRTETFLKTAIQTRMSTEFKSIINNHQFQIRFKEGCNTTLALLKCQHFCLSIVDHRVFDYVGVLSFDFSMASDTVFHKIICDKLNSTNINPYIINWITSAFLDNRKQRVVVDDAWSLRSLSLIGGFLKAPYQDPFYFLLWFWFLQ